MPSAQNLGPCVCNLGPIGAFWDGRGVRRKHPTACGTGQEGRSLLSTLMALHIRNTMGWVCFSTFINAQKAAAVLSSPAPAAQHL